MQINSYRESEYIFTFLGCYIQGERKRLKNVHYQIKFLSETGQCLNVNGKTDANGRTVPVSITENGKLSITVEGYSSIKSTQKKLITPRLLSGPTMIDINSVELKRNSAFISQAEYHLQQLNGQQNPKVLYGEYKKQRTRIQTIRHDLVFKSYALFQFINSLNTVVSEINYQIFALGQDRPVVNDRSARLNQNGFTDLAEDRVDGMLFVKYDFGKTPQKTALFEPITCIDPQEIYKIKLPQTTAITASNPEHKVCLVQTDTSRVIINPHTNEINIVPLEMFEEFDRQTKILSDAVRNVHESNAALTKAIMVRSPDEIKELEKRLNLSQEVAIKRINEEFKNPEDLTEVWVAQSTGKINRNAPRSSLVSRYMTKKNYAEIRRSRLSGLPLFAESPTATKYKPQQKPKLNNFDHKEFEIGSKEKTVYGLVGLKDEILTEYMNSDNILVHTEAQWLRMTTGAHAKGSMDTGPSGVSINTEADASLKWTLFEGFKEWRKFFPCESGWKMEFHNHDLGTIRFLMGAELYGFAGANLAISGNISVDISFNKHGNQTIQPANRPPERSMLNMLDRQNRPILQPAAGSLKQIEANKENATNQANVAITAFAGVDMDIMLQGAIEWFKPNTELGKNGEGEFVTIASVQASRTATAGFGAQGQFQIGFDRDTRNFKFLVAAHLCRGANSKGVVHFQVNKEYLPDFFAFIKLQLLQAGFQTLVYVQSQAFSTMAQILAYCIGNNHQLTKGVEILAKGFAEWLDRLDQDQERLNMARNINSPQGRAEFIRAWPESKGILLYGVTHWSDRTAAIFDSNITVKTAITGDFETFTERKKAVINILKTCLTRSEWQNTIQHIHPQGKKLSCEQLGRVEGDLVRFLNHGHDHSMAQDIISDVNQGKYGAKDSMSPWLKEYLKYREQAHAVTESSCHYLLVQNQDQPAYKQFVAQQGLISEGFEAKELKASNMHIMTAFNDPSATDLA